MRWSPEGSPPGTVVVPIMFHSIVKSGHPVTASTDISEEQLQSFVMYAKYLGFETITTAQLQDFLYNNARIPARSMILIIDDRRPGVVQDNFMPILKENNWTATLAWIIADTGKDLWTRMEELNATGRLDVQSHGYLHRYIVPETPEDVVREEIARPISILEQHFGQRPIAFIWPGGNFTPFSVQVAHENDYKLGFTAYTRGPLLFNWIPQGEPERAIGDPLMLLPRYWSNSGSIGLDEAVRISARARQQAIDQYDQEAAWYLSTCGGKLPPLSQILPQQP